MSTGRGPGYEEFNETCLTKTIKEDDEVMILQLRQDEDGPVWKQTQIPARRRSSLWTEWTTPLLMPGPKGGARPEGGLVITGVANKREEKKTFSRRHGLRTAPEEGSMGS